MFLFRYILVMCRTLFVWILLKYFVFVSSVLRFSVDGVKLVAYLSQNGLHGEIHFSPIADGFVQIESSLETTLQHPDQIWSWNIHQMPVDYTEVDGNRRCSPSVLGTQLASFDDSLGYLVLPGNESTTWKARINLTGKEIPVRNRIFYH